MLRAGIQGGAIIKFVPVSSSVAVQQYLVILEEKLVLLFNKKIKYLPIL